MDATKLVNDIFEKEEDEAIDKFVHYLDYTCGIGGRTGSDEKVFKEKLKKFIHGEDYTR